jgi:hypothetical protein
MSLVTGSLSLFHPSRNGVIGPIQDTTSASKENQEVPHDEEASFLQESGRAEAGHKPDAEAVKS